MFFDSSNREALDDGEVHVCLSRPAQNVAPDVADVSSVAPAWLSRSSWESVGQPHHGPHKSERVEEISGRNVAGRRVARRARRPAGPRESLFAPK